MVEELMNEEYDQEGVDAFMNTGRPIPGQSLMNDPEQPRPFESPPEFTDFRQALNYIVDELLVEDVYVPIVVAIGDGIPITDITMQMLYVGFREGKWNPDLLMLLVEPVCFVLMALCEKAGVDYRLTGDEEDDNTPEEEQEILEGQAKNLADMAKEKLEDINKVPEGAIPETITQKIEALDIPTSLLERTEEPTEEGATNLLDRTE